MIERSFSNHCLQEFIRYASLNVLGMIGLSCYILADTFFVANGLGSNGLAALNLAIPVFSFIHGTGLMLGMGGVTRYSMLRAQEALNTAQIQDKAIPPSSKITGLKGAPTKSSVVFSHTLLFGLCFELVFVAAGLFFATPLARLLGADAAVFGMCQIYLKVLLLFSPMFILNDIILCFVRNDGAPQLAMAAMVTGSLSNILLDYIFIFPLKMGIFGAVLATGFAPVISLMVMSPFFLKKKNHFRLVKSGISFSISGHIFAGGLPSLVTEVSSGIVIIVFNIIILGLTGNTGVAAYGVIANLSLVVIAIYTGIAQGIQPIISRYYGSGSREQIQAVLRYAFVTVAALSLVIYGCVFLWASGITALFNSENNALLTDIAVPGLRIYFTGGLFAGLNIVLSIFFTSTDNPGPANVLSLLRGFLVIIPMAFLLAKLFALTGLWAAFPATEVLVAGVGMVLFKTKKSS